MSFGLDINHPILKWRWLPTPPLPLNEALPERIFSDASLFPHGALPPEELRSFQASFPQLARQTPDLHFYRLVQLFNAPLRSLSTRDAGRSGFAYWQGEVPQFRSDYRFAHLWFFRGAAPNTALAVAALIVVEYGFGGELTLRSDALTALALRECYEYICRCLYRRL